MNELQNIDLKKHALILFDGECMFCDNTVQFIIKHDQEEYFIFSPLQSTLGKEVLRRFDGPSNIDSIVLVDDHSISIYSTAVLRIFIKLNYFRILMRLGLIVPLRIRDFFYKSFAKRRYALFGKKHECEIPSKEIRKRFIFD